MGVLATCLTRWAGARRARRFPAFARFAVPLITKSRNAIGSHHSAVYESAGTGSTDAR